MYIVLVKGSVNTVKIQFLRHVNVLENKNFIKKEYNYKNEYYEYDTGDNSDFGIHTLFLNDEEFKNLKEEKIIAYLKIDKDDFNIKWKPAYGANYGKSSLFHIRETEY